MPKRTLVLLIGAAAAAAIVAFSSVREPVLRAAGWALVANEPVAPADIIVVSLDSGGAGALEAADLVQSGIATRVAVFTDPPSGEDHEFIRRGLPYEDASARQIRQLRWLGVTDVVQIPRTEIGTEGEGLVLPLWCDQHQFRSIVFVAARDHSRRLRSVLNRVMKGHPTRVTIQPARYSSFDPDRWWETRDGIRTEIVELQKLFLEAVLHPQSFLTVTELLPPASSPVAYETGALHNNDLKRVTADATVRPEAVTIPTDSELVRPAIQGFNRPAKKIRRAPAAVVSAPPNRTAMMGTAAFSSLA
jgi:hypothetical protein